MAEDTFDKVQKAVKAYAAARDSAEENGATLGAKLAKAAKQVRRWSRQPLQSCPQVC